uniref:Uncharacterized protein n=1 Tax=Oryzias latipes TaxID=8090 RepID=A0A3P9JI25_ORYLA
MTSRQTKTENHRLISSLPVGMSCHLNCYSKDYFYLCHCCWGPHRGWGKGPGSVPRRSDGDQRMCDSIQELHKCSTLCTSVNLSLARAGLRRLPSVKPGFDSGLLLVPFSTSAGSKPGLRRLRQEGHPA